MTRPQPLTTAAGEAASPADQTPTEIRLRLLEQGYAPLPLNGKFPAPKEWQHKHHTNPAEIRLWDKSWPTALNTGVLTRHTPFLDIDVLIPEAASAAEQLIRERFDGQYVITRFGNAPKRGIPFQTTTPFKKITVPLIAPDGSEDERIEFLGDGQQVVVHGPHPETHKPYWWVGVELWGIHHDDLPGITAEQAQQLVNDLVELLASFGYRRKDKQRDPKQPASNGEKHDWPGINDLIEHDDLTPFAAKLLKAGMSIGAAVNMMRRLVASLPDVDENRRARRLREIPSMVRSGAELVAQESKSTPVDLEICDAGNDVAPPSPREWLQGNQFCRGFLSSLVAPGATGKSALRYLQAIAQAIGRALAKQHIFVRARVLLVSLEDDLKEMQRRIWAVRMHHHVEREELEGWLFYCAPKGLKLAEMANGSRQLGKLETALRRAIERYKPDLVMLDPFVKLHAFEENDNGAMDFVCDLLATLAIEYNIGVDAPHHTKTGNLAPGDADSGRGGSAIRDAGRLIYTLTTMTEDEAKTFGIAPADRRAYIRLDSAKVNLAPGTAPVAWFKLVGVRLANRTDLYPVGDEIQTVEPWKPPELWADVTTTSINAILTAIDAGMPNGQRYSDGPSAKGRAAWTVVLQYVPSKTEAQARQMVKTWLRNGVLYPEKYDDPINRKERTGLRLDTSKKPS